MLITADPEVALRFGDQRSVLNSVFIEETTFASAKALQRLAHYAKEACTLRSGYVDTTWRHLDPTPQEDLQPILRELTELMRGYEFLDEDNAYELEGNLQFMASQGAIPHADCYNTDWQDTLFWVYVLHSTEADLVFPNLGIRIDMKPGQLIVFDPGQPHAVVARNSALFRHCDFPAQKWQTYLAGHVNYEKPFWHRLDVVTDKQMLKTGPLRDVCRLKVNVRSGRLQKDQ